MKNTLVFILFLFPTLLFAQQDSTKQTFRIGKPLVTVAGRSKGLITKRALLQGDGLTLKGNTKGNNITGFTMAIHYEWGECDSLKKSSMPMVSTSMQFTKEMIKAIGRCKSSKCYKIFIRFSNITYAGSDGVSNTADDISFILNTDVN